MRRIKHRNHRGGRIAVPILHKTHSVQDIITIVAETALTDMEGTLGTTEIHASKHEIHVRMNVSHPGIRAAALARDHDLLTAYEAEMTWMAITAYRRETGQFPWPHEEWPEYMEACRRLGEPTHDLDKIQ